MTGASLELTLLQGARELLAAHARELPQRDDLCGAFCGALALRAAGIATTTSAGGSGAGAVRMASFQRARVAHPRPTARSRRRGADRRVSRGAQPLDDRPHER
jgi:hypothetical protein